MPFITFVTYAAFMIYFAPIQGFTDYIYRMAYAKYFEGIDKFFTPYISVKNEIILNKYIQDILPEHNLDTHTIPQILASDEKELLFLSDVVKNYGYTEINLNMGCPYPMVTNRGKGAGLLENPETLKTMLESFFQKANLQLSVKIRAGMNSVSDAKNILPVLNDFPITEIIFHPRLATQLYKGEILESAFEQFAEKCHHRLVYNGDIFLLKDFEIKSVKFAKTENWMLGRGILMNPFLPAEINGNQFSEEFKRKQLLGFHNFILKSYIQKMDNEGNALNKMKQFWIYFSWNFNNSKKQFRKIKKCNSMLNYPAIIQEIFDSY